MRTHPAFTGILAAVLLAAGADAQSIAVLKGRGNHGTGFNVAFQKLGWEPRFFACTKEGMADFTSSIARYDVVLSVPLFNYAGDKWMLAKEATDTKKINAWLEKGGMLVMADGSTALRQPSEKILENYYANSQLRKPGAMVKAFELSDFAVGKGRLKMELLKAAPAGSSVTYEIISAENKTQSFTANIVGAACELDFTITSRGPVTASLLLNTQAGRKTLFRRRAELPSLLTISPNAYHGILSTKRRLPDVDFKVSLAHDARGIFWYCWKQAGGGPLGIGLHDNEACQKEIAKLCEEIKVMTPGLTSAVRRPFGEGDIHGIVCGDRPGSRFLTMVNVSSKQVFEDKPAELVDGRIQPMCSPSRTSSASTSCRPTSTRRRSSPRPAR
ncbi:MAG: hypothetical protein FJ291_14470 [Planctomycetes bacterium]|nr:hypothetical protein [Planctomycetota bacterium]